MSPSRSARAWPQAALVAEVDGSFVDLTQPIESDVKLRLLTDRDPEALEVYRHSAAHLLAAATLEIYPDTKLGVGPPTEQGFFYDMLRDEPFTPEDLEKIEAKMQEIVDQDLPNRRVWMDRDEALKLYTEQGDFMKCELISEKTDDPRVSIYKTGDKFNDFCRGPHIPSMGRVKAFKLLSVAGSYWKGDEKGQRLQRVYGTAFFSKKDLKKYLNQLEEAKKRDHRKLGRELDLFSIQDTAGPGLIFWHPKGGLVRKIIEEWLRDQCVERGYGLVTTPHVAKRELWEISGHADFYSDDMFKPMELDNIEYQLKPMNCPFHILIYKNKLQSYRDLPVRLAEFGTVYRYERSGVMHGLLRVRGFTQGRRSHLLHAGPGDVGGGRLRGLRAGRAEDLRLLGLRSRAFHLGRRRVRQVRRHSRGVGACREGPTRRACPARHRSQSDAGRGGVLRTEDRRQDGGCHRPQVAALDGPV